LAAAADKLVDDVPIPEDVRVEVPPDAPEALSRFFGIAAAFTHPTAAKVENTRHLLRAHSRGGKFERPTLWLYGQHDSFYSIEHSRSNFDVFKKAGGNGEFFEYAVPGGIGHGLTRYPSLWSGDVEKYLTAIGAPLAQ
jgi:pimeloyl-ACP methyl ester carboxylesterase